MKSLEHISHVLFVGIGGIGMSALARYCQLQGKVVLGYDKTKTQLTAVLEQEGMFITYEDDVKFFSSFNLNAKNTLIVYTPAIPNNSKLMQFFKESGFEILKRAKLLGLVTEDSFCLAVAGTHGKTTTSAILGHLLAASDMPVTAFLGGISENYNSNFIHKGNAISVVEADEYDRSFLQLYPDVACVTSMDADHLDIYGTAETLASSFVEFTDLVKDKEKVLFRKGLPLNGRTVAVDESADYEAKNIRIVNGAYVFDLKTPKSIIKDLKFLLPGHHNLQNAVTALGMALLAGAPLPSLPEALLSFKGVQRRFSYRIRRDDLVLIDDYAHHPTEINALFQAVTEMYPSDRKQIVFQPHLFSRTRDFLDGFAESLSQFDEVLLLDIYPARELPISGIDSELLLAKISNKNKAMATFENLGEKLKNSSCKIKLMVGAGDIGEEVGKVTEYLAK